MPKKKECTCKKVTIKDEHCKTHGGHDHHHCCCCHHHHWCHCPPRWNPYWNGTYYYGSGYSLTSGGTTITSSGTLTAGTITYDTIIGGASTNGETQIQEPEEDEE